MGTDLLPEWIREHYEVHEWKHACAILYHDFPNEWRDIVEVLQEFRLKKADIMRAGGNKSPISKALDSSFYKRKWAEKQFVTKITVDNAETLSPTHAVDCYRNGVGIEVEWNNKDPFFDRDLNNFRLLFDLRVISVGIILTRCDELQDIRKGLGNGSSYATSTTHISKLIPKIHGGGAAGCPLLVFGIGKKLYVDDDHRDSELPAPTSATPSDEE